MTRLTTRFPGDERELVEEIERLVAIGAYPNRSEVIRTAVREHLAERADVDLDLEDEQPDDKHRIPA